MPNTIRRQLVSAPVVKKAARPASTPSTGSSMLRSANIVELFETAGYDAKALQVGRVAPPAPVPAAAGDGPVARARQWLGLIADQLNQGRETLSRTADHNEVTDPLHDSRQAFSTFQMDAKRLSTVGANTVPDWNSVTTAYNAMVNGFKGGVCEDPDPTACIDGLTTYYEEAEELDRLAEDVLWRAGNLRTLAQSFPPYLAALAEDWIETIDLLRLPLAACVFYWGVEQTTASSLEIAKYNEDDPRVAGYARQQFQRLEQFRRRTELVASVERTRELVIATGRYWSDTGALLRALGPFAAGAWELLESARDALGQAKDAAWSKVKAATVASETGEPRGVAAATATATTAAGPPARPIEPAAQAAPTARPTPSAPPVMRARPVTSGGRAQPAVETPVDAIIRAAQKLAEDAVTLKEETAARTAERQPSGPRRRARR
jgi:hypothetical protein